jgi:hypothetical protein
MISLSVLFWIFVVLFAIIGGLRGWAKEILVTAGAIVALFLVTIAEAYIPFIRDNLTQDSAFWVRVSLLGVMTFFGYQTPNFPKIMSSGKFIRDRFEDVLLGIFLGAVNGYMIFGSAWFYLMEANYPFKWITPPAEMSQNVLGLIKILPPQWLIPPAVYIAVAAAFVFVLVVFI